MREPAARTDLERAGARIQKPAHQAGTAGAKSALTEGLHSVCKYGSDPAHRRPATQKVRIPGFHVPMSPPPPVFPVPDVSNGID